MMDRRIEFQVDSFSDSYLIEPQDIFGVVIIFFLNGTIVESLSAPVNFA